MKKGAVVIGVNKTGDLPVLQAAVSGAKEFAEWAKTQGFEVVLLTDENNQPVTLSRIRIEIFNFVQQATFSQLIVFFAGHGMLRGPDFELWLLSGAPADPNEAVNVSGSISLARNNTGIRHITIISDACRSKPDNFRFSQVSGGIIFPNDAIRKPRPEMDIFYAALPGDPALEASANTVAKDYRGIFTECLLNGLNGSVPQIIEELNNPLPRRWVIPAWKLKPYLEEAVPNAASDIALQLQQEPEIRVESHPPNYFVEMLALPTLPKIIGEAPPKSPPNAIPKGLTLPPPPLQKVFSDLKPTEYLAKDIAVSAEVQALAQRTGVGPAMERIIEAKGRVSFETRTGFTVVGSDVTRARATGTNCDLFNEANAVQIRAYETGDGVARSILFQLANGNGVVLAILPGFIGSVLVEDGRVVNVNYTPSRGTPKYTEYQQVAEQLEKRRAFVAVAARHGSFRLEGNQRSTDAQYFRLLKSLDPTLGLYTAYAYAQTGAEKPISSIYRSMIHEPEPLLFDIALLAQRLPTSKRSRGYQRIAPFCPMLTQGWALLPSVSAMLPTIVYQAGQHLVPTLWTTFRPEGFEILWNAVEKGEIR